MTDDRTTASDWLRRFTGGGVDGVVAKHRELRYEPGVRAMVKIKTQRSALCVAAGFRVYEDTLLPSSILLGLYDGARLRNVGIASGFGRRRSEQLLDDLRPSIVPIDGHPWEQGFGPARSSLGRLRGAASRWNPQEMDLDWIPLRAGLVCEVTYEQADRRRLRHPARFVTWRSDVDARLCTVDQLDSPPVDLSELLA
jgi:ATP-dependent DNA ligase